MSEENAPQKERFLREVEQQLLRKELDAKLLEDGLVHVSWNEKPLCSVDRDGIVRFRPADITGPEVDRQLRTVIQAAGQVKEYMRIFERAPALKAIGLEDTYKVLADFGDAVLAGRSCKTGAEFVTWEWDFDRQGVHAGHYFMENYEAAKQDFAARAGLVNEQRLFSDEQLAVIRNTAFRLNVESSDPRYSFHHTGTDGSLYVFEAPIDMLSYISMNPHQWQAHSYVACCGTSPIPVMQMLKPDTQIVYLCLDNDDAGHKASERMAEQLRERGVMTERLVPELKDWNEDLLHAQKEELAPCLSL